MANVESFLPENENEQECLFSPLLLNIEPQILASAKIKGKAGELGGKGIQFGKKNHYLQKKLLCS